jgi:L-arabinose isomerase
MNEQPRAGLLPLFLELYDRVNPGAREFLQKFLREVADGLGARGLEIRTAPVCRLEPEFAAAVGDFERSGVDALVTLHLAYSPSEESIGPLSQSRLPIVVLDTTPDPEFGPDVDPSRIMYNHGIHGVQDMANMLRRRGKRFEIVAGHWRESGVLDRCADLVRAARAAARFGSTRALRIGDSFRGMGDFAVPEEVMRRALGISVQEIPAADLAPCAAGVSAEALEEEMARDAREFAIDCPAEVHRRSVLVGLALRALLEEGAFGAFSMNFLAFDSAEGPVSSVPFLEAGKAMGRGIGYAGEGDVLTAALVGALLSAWPRTTFTEIFCPDWKGDSLFLSHMGEINPRVSAEPARLCERPFPYTPARNPAVLACAPAPGEAALVNLAPGPCPAKTDSAGQGAAESADTFTLIAAPVEVLGDATNPAMKSNVRGWVRPRLPVAKFLEAYSRAGGTHHSALLPGDHLAALRAFARGAGLGFRQIG